MRAQTPTDTLRPGDPRVTARRIVPHASHWKITYLTPDGQMVSGGPKRVATWYDTVTTTKWKGRGALLRRQVLRNPANDVIETIDNWIDPATFVPFATENHYPPSNTASLRTYDGRHVTEFDPDSTAPDEKKQIDVTLDEPVFDFFGGTYDLLLSGFPLRAGLRARFPADNGGTSAGAALEWVTITVTGRDTIDTGTPRGKVAAWHVETDATSVGRFAFWIADKAPYMLRMWYIGPRGGKQVWDIG